MKKQSQAVPWDGVFSHDPAIRLFRYTQTWAQFHPIMQTWISYLRWKQKPRWEQMQG